MNADQSRSIAVCGLIGIINFFLSFLLLRSFDSRRSGLLATLIPALRTQRYPRRRPPDRPILSRCQTAAAIPSYRPSSLVLLSSVKQRRRLRSSIHRDRPP